MRTRFPDLAGTWTDEDARTMLEEWRRSGDSIAAFARRRSVSAWRLYAWRKKLRTTATSRAGPALSLVPGAIVAVSGATLTLRLLARSRSTSRMHRRLGSRRWSQS